MKVYVSGPMTGISENNHPAFNKVAAKWRGAGWNVFNPAESFGGDYSKPREVFMKLDIQEVLNSDAIVMLDGWEESKGACTEHRVAEEIGLKVYHDALGVPFLDSGITVKKVERFVEEFKEVDGGGARFNEGKLPIDMIPPVFIKQLAEVCRYGAKKYAAENWYRGMSWRSVYGCMMRHSLEWFEGTETDEESKCKTLAHVAWNAMALMVYESDERFKEFDDRPFKGDK